MFFIGIVGVMDQKSKIRDIKLAPCRVCEAPETGTLIRIERVFSLFFVPVYRWNKRYAVQCKRCGTLYWLTREKGESLESGQEESIGYWEMLENKMIRGGICPDCQQRVLPSFRYCPYCGKKL